MASSPTSSRVSSRRESDALILDEVDERKRRNREIQERQIKYDELMKDLQLNPINNNNNEDPRMRSRLYMALDSILFCDGLRELLDIFYFFWDEYVYLIKKQLVLPHKVGRREVVALFPSSLYIKVFTPLIKAISPLAERKMTLSRDGTEYTEFNIQNRSQIETFFKVLGAPEIFRMKMSDGTLLFIDDREPFSIKYRRKRLSVSFCVCGLF
jgi:hypothetical protein